MEEKENSKNVNNGDKYMKLLGYIEKTTEGKNYILAILDNYYRGRLNQRTQYINTPTADWLKQGIDLNVVINHVAYEKNGTQHALVVPTVPYKGFEHELFTDIYLVYVQPDIREKAQDNIFANRNLANENDLYYAKLNTLDNNRKAVSLTKSAKDATIYTGREMIKAMKAILLNSDYGINDIVAVNLNRKICWQFSGY